MPSNLLASTVEHWALISVIAFLAFAALETVRPDRRDRPHTTGRWTAHIGIYVLDLVLSSSILPWLMLGVIADAASPDPVRLFRALDAIGGPWLMLAVGLITIDFLVYWVHRMQHGIHVFWRFHAVHHADTEMDISTTLLHHPVAYLGVAASVGLVMHGLGVPPWVFPVYGLFEVALGAFQHVATPVPDRFERAVRWLLVTPGMHQVHHSTEPAHFDRNFGIVLSVWDRLFGTYIALGHAERERIRFGVEPDLITGRPIRALTLPFHMRRPDATPLDLGEARAP